jgi:hypothetical protein
MFSSNLQVPVSLRSAVNLLRKSLWGVLALATLGTAAQAQTGRFDIQQIGDALTSYGKNTVSQNGKTYYTVQCGHGGWQSNVVVSLSPNGNVIWMSLDLVPLPSKISPTAMLDLLKKNSDLGPIFFSIGENWLRISSPVPNNNMSEARLKAYVEQLVNSAVDTHDLWNSKTLEATSRVSSIMHPQKDLAPVVNAFRRLKSDGQ